MIVTTTRAALTVMVSLSFLSACSTFRSKPQDATITNTASDCRSWARNQLTANSVDKFWRDHEFYRLVQACQTSQQSQ